MSDGFLTLELGEISRITLDQPQKRNALSLEMMRALLDAFEQVERDPMARVVILSANGPTFCAGHDLRELAGRDLRAYREIFDICTRLMAKIQAIPQPVIAQVHALATAAGCQLVATCDLAIASEGAQFATPGVRIGLFCTTPMVALTRAVGRKRAMEMLLCGAPIDAATAAAWGLVNRVVPTNDLASATLSMAQQIANASRLTVAIGKQAFYSQIDLDQSKAYDYAREVMSMNAMASDAQEGICAFLEKRPPRWD